jgi:hypothetical protein
MRENSAGSIMGLLLAAGGAYLLYEYFFAKPATAAPSPTPGTTVAPASATSPSVVGTQAGTGGSVTPVQPASLTSSIGSAFLGKITSVIKQYYPSGIPSLTAFQWNYYANIAWGNPLKAGAPQPDPSVLGVSSTAQMDLNSWMQAYLNWYNKGLQTGVSGLGCVTCGRTDCHTCGLGMTNTNLIYTKLFNRVPGEAIADFANVGHRAKKLEFGLVRAFDQGY